MTNVITVHAKERGRAPSNLPRSTRILHTAYFDITILPSSPLHIGQRVQVNTISGIDNPTASERASLPQKWYTSSPTDVAGTIVGIRTMELAVTELIVLNELPQSLVEHAYLTIQHIQGVTVTLDLWRRIARTTLLPLLAHTRHVPVERNAVIIPEDEQDL